VPEIGVFSVSRLLTASDVDFMVRAVNTHHYDVFDEAWGLEPWPVVWYKNPNRLPLDCYPIVIADTPEEAGYYGYHSADFMGRYYGRIFVEPVYRGGGSALFDDESPGAATVASVLDHEVKELRCDPLANRYFPGPRIAEGASYAKEVVDPVQGDIVPVTVSRWGRSQTVGLASFIYPEWFDKTAHGPVDYLENCPGPFQLAPGGYMVVADDAGTDSQIFNAKAPPQSWVLEMRKQMERSRLRARRGGTQ
jgi:hypothetical protein